MREVATNPLCSIHSLQLIGNQYGFSVKQRLSCLIAELFSPFNENNNNYNFGNSGNVHAAKPILHRVQTL